MPGEVDFALHEVVASAVVLPVIFHKKSEIRRRQLQGFAHAVPKEVQENAVTFFYYKTLVFQ